jgi:hypothetical protein
MEQNDEQQTNSADQIPSHSDQADGTKEVVSEAEDNVADSLEALRIEETPDQKSHNGEEKGIGLYGTFFGLCSDHIQ